MRRAARATGASSCVCSAAAEAAAGRRRTAHSSVIAASLGMPGPARWQIRERQASGSSRSARTHRRARRGARCTRPAAACWTRRHGNVTPTMPHRWPRWAARVCSDRCPGASDRPREHPSADRAAGGNGESRPGPGPIFIADAPAHESLEAGSGFFTFAGSPESVLGPIRDAAMLRSLTASAGGSSARSSRRRERPTGTLHASRGVSSGAPDERSYTLRRGVCARSGKVVGWLGSRPDYAVRLPNPCRSAHRRGPSPTHTAIARWRRRSRERHFRFTPVPPHSFRSPRAAARGRRCRAFHQREENG